MKLNYPILASILLIVSLNLPCHTNSQPVRIDHVICLVNDIDKSSQYFNEKGFTIKKGRLHKNGLINAHIKFGNNSSFELMSIKGEPTDNIAKNYKNMLKESEGVVYIAFTGIKTELITRKLTQQCIKYSVTKLKNWTYITFPINSGLEHLFFINYKINVNDLPKTLILSNGTEKILDVYLEGGKNVKLLFNELGFRKGKIISHPIYGNCFKYETSTGNLIVIKPRDKNKRPRILEVLFSTNENINTYRLSF